MDLLWARSPSERLIASQGHMQCLTHFYGSSYDVHCPDCTNAPRILKNLKVFKVSKMNKSSEMVTVWGVICLSDDMAKVFKAPQNGKEHLLFSSLSLQYIKLY